MEQLSRCHPFLNTIQYSANIKSYLPQLPSSVYQTRAGGLDKALENLIPALSSIHIVSKIRYHYAVQTKYSTERI